MTTHERVYRGLLRIYPADFRDEYEAEMVQLFADQLRDVRAGGAPTGSFRLWLRTVADVITSAISEYLRRNRTMAHSAQTVPTLPARVLGGAGVLAGLVLVAPLVITFDNAWYGPHIIVFNAFVIALAVGLHRRQTAVSPRLAVAATALVVIANAWYLAMTALGMADLNPFGTAFGFIGFLAGITLWTAAAAYGVASLFIGAVSRWGPILLLIGSPLAILGIDRIGLAGEGSIFGPVALFGLFLHAAGWMLLGAELALRSTGRQAPTQSA